MPLCNAAVAFVTPFSPQLFFCHARCQSHFENVFFCGSRRSQSRQYIVNNIRTCRSSNPNRCRFLWCSAAFVRSGVASVQPPYWRLQCTPIRMARNERKLYLVDVFNSFSGVRNFRPESRCNENQWTWTTEFGRDSWKWENRKKWTTWRFEHFELAFWLKLSIAVVAWLWHCRFNRERRFSFNLLF